jgi:hypothetical protein
MGSVLGERDLSAEPPRLGGGVARTGLRAPTAERRFARALGSCQDGQDGGDGDQTQETSHADD